MDWIPAGFEFRTNNKGVSRFPSESLLDTDWISTGSKGRGSIDAESSFSPEDVLDSDGILLETEYTGFIDAKRSISLESLLDWVPAGVEVGIDTNGVSRFPPKSLLDTDWIPTGSEGRGGGIDAKSSFSPEDMLASDGTLVGIGCNGFIGAERSFSRESLSDWIPAGVEVRTNINGVSRFPPESLSDTDWIPTGGEGRGGY